MYWTQTPQDQGQIVDVYYSWLPEDGVLLRRSVDRSDPRLIATYEQNSAAFTSEEVVDLVNGTGIPTDGWEPLSRHVRDALRLAGVEVAS